MLRDDETLLYVVGTSRQSGREGIFNERRNRTGLVWRRPAIERARTVRLVCETLEKEYGKPRFGNPQEPVDDLIYVILSNRTSPVVAQRVYASLKGRFVTWDRLLTSSSVSELAKSLQPAGLAVVKSRQIWGALEKIRTDFGSCDIGHLRDQPAEAVENYLVSLPGVSLKVAKCVMMYTLDAEVLPVDSHVHRVTKRLGWNDRKRADQCHEELEALVPSHLRYALHVDCIAHGRSICRSDKPACGRCCVNRHCAYFNHAA